MWNRSDSNQCNCSGDFCHNAQQICRRFGCNFAGVLRFHLLQLKVAGIAILPFEHPRSHLALLGRLPCKQCAELGAGEFQMRWSLAALGCSCSANLHMAAAEDLSRPFSWSLQWEACPASRQCPGVRLLAQKGRGRGDHRFAKAERH